MDNLCINSKLSKNVITGSTEIRLSYFETLPAKRKSIKPKNTPIKPRSISQILKRDILFGLARSSFAFSFFVSKTPWLRSSRRNVNLGQAQFKIVLIRWIVSIKNRIFLYNMNQKQICFAMAIIKTHILRSMKVFCVASASLNITNYYFFRQPDL